MKTNQKLLLGLIIACMLMITFVIGVVKYYDTTATGEREPGSDQATDELSFREETISKAGTLYFPMALLQPPLQLR